MTCGIYSIVCLPTGKRYTGSSIKIEKRWLRHKWELNTNRHGNQYLQRAWDKYGAAAFSFKILEPCKRNRLIEKEKLHMVATLSPNGFNLRTDPVSLYGSSNPFFGKKHSQATKEKISRAKKGVPLSEETKLKLRISSFRRKLSDQDVLEIRKKYDEGIHTCIISAEYNIARSYVYDLVNKKRRSYVG